MNDPSLPSDPNVLNRLYDETVEHHRNYLEKLHEAFNRRCEEIRVKTHAKLDALPESAQEERQRVIVGEKAELDKTLAELKQAINKSSNDARQRLEEIESKLEASSSSLEQELAKI